MKPFEKCPVCGGELIETEVEKLLRGGNNFATVKYYWLCVLMVLNISCFQSSQDYCYETKGIKALELFCGVLLKN